MKEIPDSFLHRISDFDHKSTTFDQAFVGLGAETPVEIEGIAVTDKSHRRFEITDLTLQTIELFATDALMMDMPQGNQFVPNIPLPKPSVSILMARAASTLPGSFTRTAFISWRASSRRPSKASALPFR